MKELITKNICISKDIGLNDNLFGGIIMCWLDFAGVIFVSEKIKYKKILTAKVTTLDFKHPVRVGDSSYVW